MEQDPGNGFRIQRDPECRIQNPVPCFQGAVAQLGERFVRNEEVRGSSPLSSMDLATLAQLVEHIIRNDGVVGSSPTGGSYGTHRGRLGYPDWTVFCGSSSVGRASASQAEGRGFEPRLPLWRRARRRTQILPLGVIGNTPDSGSGESWFEPRRGNRTAGFESLAFWIQECAECRILNPECRSIRRGGRVA